MYTCGCTHIQIAYTTCDVHAHTHTHTHTRVSEPVTKGGVGLGAFW